MQREDNWHHVQSNRRWLLPLILLAPLGCASADTNGQDASTNDQGPFPILINNAGTYTGQWRLDGDEHYSIGSVTRVLPAGRHVLVAGEYARFAFEVEDKGTTIVEPEYEAGLQFGADLDFRPEEIVISTDGYAGTWNIHRVANNEGGRHVWLLPNDANNGDGTMGAPYRFSFSDDTSAVRLELSSSSLTVSPGNNTGTGGIHIPNRNEIHLQTRRIKVSEVTSFGGTWSFRGHTENFGDAHVNLIPEIPFYFIAPDRSTTQVHVTAGCQVYPERIQETDAMFELFCDDPDYPDYPDSVIVTTDDGAQHEITTVVGSYYDLQHIIEPQAWYTGDYKQNEPAQDFSWALGDCLGRPNTHLGASVPPAFAYSLENEYNLVFTQAGDSYELPPYETITWAIVSPTSDPHASICFLPKSSED